ncbi:DUF1542 domain-containing protein, partial [Staphylococcus aureus]|uniref:DUF1542 domain-containing protein n=1 Tax=Staphylococcus aureus TaxID=1280 RepID=UPI0011A40DBE
QQPIKPTPQNQLQSIKHTPHPTLHQLHEPNQLITHTLKQAQQQIENTNQHPPVTHLTNQTINTIDQIKPKLTPKPPPLDTIQQNNKNQLHPIPNTFHTTQHQTHLPIHTLNKILNTI